MNDLRATLRLQFHQGFTLDDAVPLVQYFSRLGISHIYASPLLTARPGSMHGYDVIDPTRINPELGGEPALVRLVEALRSYRIGLILDIVSNHMAVGGDGNPWWLDV
ncbi:MAG TPA: malto-oligosyltrehalose synthase, partial [Streptomyces sp.]|nr:malto-oligosyltrehalose synthase [Streptomyces sp.]